MCDPIWMQNDYVWHVSANNSHNLTPANNTSKNQSQFLSKSHFRTWPVFRDQQSVLIYTIPKNINAPIETHQLSIECQQLSFCPSWLLFTESEENLFPVSQYTSVRSPNYKPSRSVRDLKHRAHSTQIAVCSGPFCLCVHLGKVSFFISLQARFWHLLTKPMISTMTSPKDPAGAGLRWNAATAKVLQCSTFFPVLWVAVILFSSCRSLYFNYVVVLFVAETFPLFSFSFYLLGKRCNEHAENSQAELCERTLYSFSLSFSAMQETSLQSHARCNHQLSFAVIFHNPQKTVRLYTDLKTKKVTRQVSPCLANKVQGCLLVDECFLGWLNIFFCHLFPFNRFSAVE